jgi:membrane-bound lytic murein transglycosylase D
MALNERFYKRLAVYVAAGLIVGFGPRVARGANPFPNPPEIQPSVQFWLGIYTRYSLREGVMHDSRYPEIVYDVIGLKHPDAPEAHRSNLSRMQKARQNVCDRIERLIQNPNSEDPELKRIADLFGTTVSLDELRQAKRRIRCQVGQRDRFREGLIRASASIETIRKIFRDAGVPEDLAYLAHVESSFNNRAHSKSGAAGIWQFTRQTGRHFLQIDHAIDERMDPIRASEAAAFLLKTNYRRLESWPLAITAYNHGMAGMRRAKRRHKTYAAIFQSYRNRRFRFASRNFYPEFLAAREAAANAHVYFDNLPTSEERPLIRVASDGFLAFKIAARHFNLDTELLGQLNPALCPSVLNGLQDIPRNYPLRLPAHEWHHRLAYNARIPAPLLRPRQKSLPVYRVRKGDTISSIAKQHDLKASDLIAANNLAKRGNRIVVNQKLRLPIVDQSL